MITGYSNTVSVTTLQTPFQFTVDTSQAGVSGPTEFTMPLTTSTGLDIDVDWGDGSPIENITDHTLATHDYGTSGTYTIKVLGSLLGWKFANGGDKLKMGDISKWGALNISVNNGFRGCTNLTCSATDAPVISTGSLERYFNSCANFNGAIGNWDMSGVLNMDRMLSAAFVFNQDVSSWDVSNVSNFVGVFSYAYAFNNGGSASIGSWDTGNATDMSFLFRDAPFNQNISTWDIDQVSNFTSFMLGATLSTTNYDALLIGWEANLQAAYPNGAGYPHTINASFGSSQYTLGGAAETARTSMINNFGWTITDGGGV